MQPINIIKWRSTTKLDSLKEHQATVNIDIIHNLVAYVRTHAHACIDTLIYICLYIKIMNSIDITRK